MYYSKSVKPFLKKTRARSDLIILSIIALLGFIVALIVDLFEKLDEFCKQYKYLRLDEILVVLMLLGLAFGIYSLRRWHELKDEIAERLRVEEALQRYAQRLENMQEIHHAILAVQSPRIIAENALHRIRQIMPCQWANVIVLDLSNQQGTALVSYLKGEITIRPAKPLPIAQLNLPNELYQGQVYLIADITNAVQPVPIEVQPLLREGLRSYISVPLICENELIGILNLAADKPAAYEPENIAMAWEVAGQLAIAIQNARLFEQVRAGQKRAQALSQLLVEAQETERRRIAYELHDEIGQALTAVKINLQASRRIEAIKPALPQIEESIGLVEQTLQQVRNLSFDLRPAMLDDLGLVVALRWYVERVAKRAGLIPQLTIDDLPKTLLPSSLATTCFRLTQEAVTNIVRHAQARQICLELRQQGKELELIIADDGVGFEATAILARANQGYSLGLLGMQERVLIAGGSLEIQATPGQGTRIIAHFPLNISHPELVVSGV